MSATGMMKPLSIACVIATFVGPAVAQETVFRTGFEYSAGVPSIGLDAAALNGADGQIGAFSGAVPAAADNSNNGPGVFMGIQSRGEPDESNVLLADRALADGSFFANMSSPVLVDGATVSFEVGTRRRNGDALVRSEKDYSVIGRDANGNESFHLRISAYSNENDPGALSRVGVFANGAAMPIFDLPTMAGADADFDLDSIGGRRRENMGILTLDLSADGFVLDFAGDRDRLTGVPAKTYTTAELGYNGDASTLAQIEFTFAGGDQDIVIGSTLFEANSFQGGYALDNLLVTGTVVPEPVSAALVLLALTGLAGSTRRRAC